MDQITVEFIGLSRILIRQKSIQLRVNPGTSYQKIINILADRYPLLVGQVISKECDRLLGSNMLNLNGKHMIQEDAMGESPQDGDRIIFMSILAGG